MALSRASASSLTALGRCFASTSSCRLIHTTTPVLGKSPPGKGKKAQRKAKLAQQKDNSKAGAEHARSKYASESMSLSEAVRLFSAVEVSRPMNAYEVHVCTTVDSHQTNALRGRLALPNEPRTKAERFLIFAEDGSEVVTAVQGLIEQNPSLRSTITIGGTELINDVVAGSGAAAGLDFTKVLCTQGLIAPLSKSLARSLGPKGLMPSAKRGTVVSSGAEMLAAIREAQGALDWRGDRNGVIRSAVGRIHFTEDQLRANIAAFLHGVVDKISLGLISGTATSGVARPSSTVGAFTMQEMRRAKSIITQIHLSSTQGPAVVIPHAEVL
jgi:large subunit ribosomal protein L1